MALLVGQLFAVLGLDRTKFDQGLQRARDELSRFTRQADNLGSVSQRFDAVGQSVMGVGRSAAATIATMLGFAGAAASIGAAAKSGVEFNAYLEQSQARWTVLLGSLEAANEQLDWMMEFAKQTPFDIKGLDEASAKLKAYGFTIEQTRYLLQVLGDTAAATGSGAEGINRLTLALGQMQAKAKVSSEEMLQLTEMGIPAWQMLADAMGVSVAELQDMVSKGLVPANKAIPILAKGLQEAFGGSMAKQAETFNGRMEQLKDSVQQLWGVAFKPLFSWLSSEALPRVTDLVDRLKTGFEDGGLRGAILALFDGEIKQRVADVYDAVHGAFGWLVEHGDVVKAIILGIASAWGTLKALQLVQWFKQVIAAQTLLNAVMNANPIGLVITAIGALVAAGYLLIKNWDQVKQTVLDVWSKIKQTVLNAIAAIVDKYAQFIGIFSKAQAEAARQTAEHLRGMAEAERAFAEERRRQYEIEQQAKADAEAAKALAAQAAAEESAESWQKAGEVEIGVWGETTEAAQESTQKKIEYLDEFNEAWKESQDYRLKEFERQQEREDTIFKRMQEDRKRAFERQLEDEADAFEDALEERKRAFERSLKDEEREYKHHQSELLRAFEERQRAELDALEWRHREERALLDAEYRQQREALEAQLEALRREEERERLAERRAKLEDAIAKAQANLARAEAVGDPSEILRAEEQLAEALADLDRFEREQQRRAEEQRIRDALAALDREYDAKMEALKAQQDAEKEALEAQLEQQREAYERQLEEERLAWERRQEERKRQFEAELEEEKRQFELKQEEAKLAFERMLEDEKTAWKHAQEDRLERYKQELEDLKASFRDKLDAQREFVAEWNRQAAMMRSMTVLAADDKAAAGARMDTLEVAKQLAKEGRVDNAAALLHDTWGIDKETAKQNLIQSLPGFAEGGVVTKPTLGVFGEAGAEAVIPLRQLWAQLQSMAQQVAQTTAQNMNGGMPLVVEVHSHTYVDGQEVKETVVRHLIPDVRQATRAMGIPVLIGG